MVRTGAAAAALRAVCSVAIVFGITLVCFRVLRLGASTTGFAYLAAILAVASGWGLIEAISASIAAVFCLNFFFVPPVLTLTVADPQNWVALFAFLATSLIASQLSARAKQRTSEALERQRDMERLYALSRSILLTNMDQNVARQIALQIAETFDFSAVALYDRSSGAIHRSGPGELLPGTDDRLRETAVKGTLFRDELTGTVVTAIRLGGEPIGALALSGALPSDTVLQALANLAAIGLERAHAQDAATRAEAARESQELKSTLLDAMAHEFKTPLTSMKAASSALLSDAVAEPEARRELVSVVDEEIDHLNRLVTEAVQVARIEAGDVQLNRARYAAAAMLEGVRREAEPAGEGRAISVEVEPNLPPLNVDAELIKLALRQLMDNALRYSPPGSPVFLRARRDGNRVVIDIRDRGSGIPAAERPRVFEKFHRGSNAGQTRGTGMGLSIAREIARAHRGDVWLEKSSPEGSEFCLSIPVTPEKAAL
ncbi:MAG TPA: ATP-binding protein [Terriglobia bacterium]|nr:ATP-binding protein [Terriglobia bacterium]